MDYTIFYVIITVVVAFGIAYLISYLRRRELVDKEDLIFASNILGLSMRIIEELRLQHEKEIRRLSLIIQDSLEFAISLYDNEQDVLQNAYEYAIDLCLAFEIEITENREEIIRELIYITFNNFYKDFVE